MRTALVSLLLALALALPAAPGGAAPPAANPVTAETLTLRAHVGGSLAQSIDSQGGLLFAGFGPTLRIFDLVTPETPAPRSHLTLEHKGSILQLDAAGKAVYLLLGERYAPPTTLAAVDISDPGAPRLAAEVALPTGASALLAEGDRVYSVSSTTVHVFDASSPARLAPLASITLPDPVTFYQQPLAAAGPLLLVSTSAELLIYDVANPRAPILLSRTLPPGPSTSLGFSIAVVGDYAYLASYRGIQAVDISNPLQPVLGGSTPAGSSAVRRLGQYIVGIDGNLFSVYNASDPLRPAFESSIAIGDTSGFLSALTVSGSYAYVTLPSSVGVVRLTDPRAPANIAQVDARPAGGPVALYGDYLYAQDTVIDVSDPGSPRVVGAYDGSIELIDGGLGYGGGGSAALRIFSLADPAAPVALGSLQGYIPGRNGLVLNGAHAYISDLGMLNKGGYSGGGLHVLSITDPVSPTQVAFHLGLITGPIARSGAYLYAGKAERYSLPFGGSFSRVRVDVFSLADPALPAAVGSVELLTSQAIESLVVSGAHLYALTGSDLYILDLADPAAPRIVARLAVGGLRLAVQQPYAYILSRSHIAVVDVSAAEWPRMRSYAPAASYFKAFVQPSLAARDDRIFLGGDGVYSLQRTTIDLPYGSYFPLMAR